MVYNVLPTSPIPSLRVIELTSTLEPELQRFFDANPQYFFAVSGEKAGPNEAHSAIHDEPPTGWAFTKKWVLGYVDPAGSIVAMADIVSDLLVKRVWHIGLFFIATERHGTGDAQTLYTGLEDWARLNGANWLRLGVVLGNARAERFWVALGYKETRTRDGVEMGRRTHTIRVMVKPVGDGTIDEYLSIVERDRPEIKGSP